MSCIKQPPVQLLEGRRVEGFRLEGIQWLKRYTRFAFRQLQSAYAVVPRNHDDFRHEFEAPGNAAQKQTGTCSLAGTRQHGTGECICYDHTEAPC